MASIDFTITDKGRLVRPGAERAATPEEIALWDALHEALDEDAPNPEPEEPTPSGDDSVTPGGGFNVF